MNRAILVVMCDFIVVSMLSMITGLSTLENPYGDDGAVVNSRTAQVIIDELRTQRSEIEESLKDLQEAQKRFGHSQAREAAIKKFEVQKAKAQMQLELLQTKDFSNIDTSERNLHDINQANLNTRYKNAMNKLNNIENKNNLDTFSFGNTAGGSGDGSGTGGSSNIVGYTNDSESAVDTEENRKIREKLAKNEVDLEHTKDELRKLQERFAQSTSDNQNLNNQITTYKTEIQTIETNLATTKEKLVTTQRHLVATKREITSREDAIKTQKNQISSTQNVVKKAVTDLSTAKKEIVEKENELSEVKKESEKIKEELNSELSEANNSLRHIIKSLETDVLTTYKETIKNLTIKNEQTRLIVDYKNGGSYYLPVIKINGKPVVVSLFRLLSGNSLNRAEFEDVKVLDYELSDPNDQYNDITKVTGPIFVSRKDIRVALLEVPEVPKETLHFLNVSAVRNRGLQDLYLFKYNQYGKDGGTLEGRCSMSASNNDDYLYIRNNNRAKDMAVLAEMGDMIMTKEGGFVGVIVELEQLKNGDSVAKCFIFPDDFELRNSIKLSIKKDISEKYYREFSNLGIKILERIKKLED